MEQRNIYTNIRKKVSFKSRETCRIRFVFFRFVMAGFPNQGFYYILMANTWIRKIVSIKDVRTNFPEEEYSIFRN